MLMTNESRFRVSNPPPKPLLIWDGECHFCRRWIERWREITRGEIDYATYQETADKFPEIPRGQFQRALAFINEKGKVFFAAEAVYQSLQHRFGRRWLSWSYDNLPGFAKASEFAYESIASHRQLGSALTRLLWGEDVRPPRYFWARKWFLRALGLVYLIAFISFWVQIDGLIGSNGILPVRQFLSAAHQQLGSRAWSIIPTFCWLNASDAFLHFLCGSGIVFSILLIAGIAPAICLLVLFAFYLSLTIAGQVFFSFQWDILLLETGFLSILLAPWRLWPKRTPVAAAPKAFGAADRPRTAGGTSANRTDSSRGESAITVAPDRSADPETAVSRAGLFLLKFLLFKLLLMSGVVKLTSGDDCWWNLTALDYHYWSQPLPTVFAWYADKGPEWFKHFSVAFCLLVEIVVPFFIWAPRRLRLIACGLLIFLQIAIAITGNYCFFNLLTITLCLLLIDDSVVGIGRSREAVRFGAPGGCALPLSIYATVAVIVVTLPINAWLIFNAFKPESKMPGIIRSAYERIEPFRIANGYGLFRVMTKDRGEIIIEGSADGIDWRAYEFKWKPGDMMGAPGWCAPHQPRLDWQMWFAALESPEQNRWLVGLVVRLFQNNPDVIHLLKNNPFSDLPPRYIRAEFYRYRFTMAEEHRAAGAWWKRQSLGEYFHEISSERLGKDRQ